MARNRIGSLRRSSVVGTYGPGAIVDFRAAGTGAPVSGVLAGLEEWDRVAGSGRGVSHEQAINEPRLQKRLYVRGFRLPPVHPDDDSSDVDILPVVQFPRWLQCPRCDRIESFDRFSADPGRPERRCPRCSGDGEEVHAVPVRFIVACEKGHLDDFPWKLWAGCTCAVPELSIRMVGPGLAGKIVSCAGKGCQGRPQSLDGIFAKTALTARGMRCRGLRPWLAVARDDTCDKPPRVLQRGASNVYWGETVSALDIPPFSTDLSAVFGRFWDVFERAEPEKWPELISLLGIERDTGIPAPVLLQTLRRWREALEGNPDEPIELAEYAQFVAASEKEIVEGEFNARPEPAPPELSPWITSVVLAHRLREVRALVGFTRIYPPSGPFRERRQRLCGLSIQPLDWLPAVELRGEGVFLRFDLGAVKEWETRPPVLARVETLRQRVAADLREGEAMPDISARFLLIHSFAHALMRQLSLGCGYSSSALRERLYVAGEPHEMAGLLIHTGSPDSEGTLGGLVRQGRTNLLVATILGALMDMSWCSSDPLCIMGTATLSSPRNAAACHACLLVPETSCQHFNLSLDRAMLVGLPEEGELGFFRAFLDERA